VRGERRSAVERRRQEPAVLATTPVTAPSVEPASPSTEISALAETDESLC
jgi:hypothetical protein